MKKKTSTLKATEKDGEENNGSYERKHSSFRKSLTAQPRNWEMEADSPGKGRGERKAGAVEHRNGAGPKR